MNWNGLAQCHTASYWFGCYRGTYDLIHPDAFTHPAKMAIPLAFKIMEHLKVLGLLQDSDTILDPMSGISTTGIVAGALGHKFIGVELEEKFIELSKKSKEYAERKLYKGFDWQLIQGDSRRLSDLLKEQNLKSILSPPYGDSMTRGGNLIWQTSHNRPHQESQGKNEIYGDTPDNIGNLKDTPLKSIVSPPYANDARLNRTMTDASIGDDALAYGKSDGQIGRMPDKPLKAITSPPWVGDGFGKSNTNTGNVVNRNQQVVSKSRDEKIAVGQKARQIKYADQTDSNIANLPDKPLKSVMSPPYETAHYKGDENPTNVTRRETERRKLFPNRPVLPGHYSDDLTNIGNQTGESYLEAMKRVYSEIALVSDVLCVVVKNPTRAGKLRRLDLDTLAILKDCGWNIHCQHRALLFEELELPDLFGETTKKVKGRMSFFKRLAWQRGQPTASWEDILICVRN